MEGLNIESSFTALDELRTAAQLGMGQDALVALARSALESLRVSQRVELSDDMVAKGPWVAFVSESVDSKTTVVCSATSGDFGILGVWSGVILQSLSFSNEKDSWNSELVDSRELNSGSRQNEVSGPGKEALLSLLERKFEDAVAESEEENAGFCTTCNYPISRQDVKCDECGSPQTRQTADVSSEMNAIREGWRRDSIVKAGLPSVGNIVGTLAKEALGALGRRLEIPPGASSEDKKDCTSCRALLAADAKFCSQCGVPQEQIVTCSSCGKKNEVGSRFCTNCGVKVG